MIFSAGLVTPDHFPTISVRVPSKEIFSIGTPNASKNQIARSPSVKPPGLYIPSISPGV